MSGFRAEVAENCAPLCYYAASTCNLFIFAFVRNSLVHVITLACFMVIIFSLEKKADWNHDLL